MKITIHTPSSIKDEREKLLDDAIDLIKQQERSCIRYCKRLNAIRNKLIRLERTLNPHNYKE